MSLFSDCIESFKKLLNIEYEIVLGRKSEKVTLKIKFEKTHFFHLVGLQHLKDLSKLLTGNREKLFDKFDNGLIKSEIIEKSKLYPQIKNRLKYFPLLEQFIDSNDTIFKFNSKTEGFSLIQFDYLMKNGHESYKIFIFLSKDSDEKFFGRSFFAEDKKDYSFGQTNWTLLKKTKITKSENKEDILFDKL